MAALAILSPLLLLTVSREWLFTPPGFIDPWHYVGFFLNYTDPRYWDDAYKLARLPWILTGALTYWIAPDSIAPYLLHIGSLVALTAGMYVLVRALFGSSTTAAVTAMLTGFLTHLHGSGGWDYHNAAAGPVYVWSLYAATLAARTPTPRRLMIVGACAALAVHVNITLVNFLPLLAAHWMVLRGGERRTGGLWRALAWAAIGGVAITGLLMLVNVAVGRPPLFFARLFDIVVRYVSNPGQSEQAQFARGWGRWVLDARHLALDAVVLVAAIGVLLHPRTRRELSIAQRLVLVEFAVMSGVWAVWESAGQTALDWEYFAYPLIPHALLALAALLQLRGREVRPWTLVAAPVMLTLALALGLDRLLQQLVPSVYSLGSVFPGLVLYAAGIGALWTAGRARMIAFTFLFAVANALSAAHPDGYTVANRCRPSADFNSGVVVTNRMIAAFDPRFKDTNIWFDENDKLTTPRGCVLKVADFGYAVAGSGLPYIAPPFPMPPAASLSDATLQGVARSRIKMLIVLAAADTEASFKARLDPLSLDYVPVARRRIPLLDGALEVVVADVVSRTDR